MTIVINSNPNQNLLESSNNSSKSMTLKICDLAEKIAITAVAVKKTVEFTSQHGTRTVCATTALFVGLQNLWNGNFWFGGTVAVAGAKELLNIYDKVNDHSDVKALINDAKAGIEMIQLLQADNKKSFEIVDTNIQLVSENIEKLTSQLSDIQLLAAEKGSDLEAQKNKATIAYEEAAQLFAKAQEAFEKNRALVSNSSQLFDRAFSQFGNLVEVVQSKEGNIADKFSQFAENAPAIHKDCLSAKAILDTSKDSFNEGYALLQKAIAKHTEASLEAGKAMEMAAQEIKTIEKIAKVEKDSKVEIQVIQQEIGEVQKRNKLTDDLLLQAHASLIEAEQKLEAQWGTFSTCVGAPIGFIAGNMMAGTVGAVAGVPVGIQLVHERKKISSLLFGSDAVPVPEKPTVTNSVTFKFNDKSTGFWGRYIQKRPSTTAGKVSIYLGKDEKGKDVNVSFEFNLNRKDPVSKKDLMDLTNTLLNQLESKKVDQDYCLKVLQQLETMEIDRKQLHKNAIGFVAKSTFLDAIRFKCK